MGARTVSAAVVFVLMAALAVGAADVSPSTVSGQGNAAAAALPPSEAFKETRPPVIDLGGTAEEGPPAQPEEQAPASGMQPEAGPGAAPEQPAYWRRIMEGLDSASGGAASATDDQGTASQTAGGGVRADAPGNAGPGEIGGGRSFNVYLKTLYGLFIALALVLILSYLVRRYGARSSLFAGASLGAVLGRIYLNPRACLHLVRIGDRIVVVGVTPNAIAALAEFDAASLSLNAAASEGSVKQSGGFLAQLRAAASRMTREDTRGREGPRESPEPDESELASLRDDIQRLQRSLRESSNEPEE